FAFRVDARVDPALSAHRVRAFHWYEREEIDRNPSFAELHHGREPGEPASDHDHAADLAGLCDDVRLPRHRLLRVSGCRSAARVRQAGFRQREDDVGAEVEEGRAADPHAPALPILEDDSEDDTRCPPAESPTIVAVPTTNSATPSAPSVIVARRSAR